VAVAVAVLVTILQEVQVVVAVQLLVVHNPAHLVLLRQTQDQAVGLQARKLVLKILAVVVLGLLLLDILPLLNWPQVVQCKALVDIFTTPLHHLEPLRYYKE
jgi:hypothetical protein